jgi:hypothetical protein
MKGLIYNHNIKYWGGSPASIGNRLNIICASCKYLLNRNICIHYHDSYYCMIKYVII